MDIDGMGEEIIGRLIESGRVTDVADYYTLDVVELSMLDMGRVNKDGAPIRLGETVAKKLMAAIDESRTRSRSPGLCSAWDSPCGKDNGGSVAAAFPPSMRSWRQAKKSCRPRAARTSRAACTCSSARPTTWL